MSKQVESAAYHEAGHLTAAVVQGMPIRTLGLDVDLYGNGCANYFQREPGDSSNTVLDETERKRTIIALYSAHAAQLRFYPSASQGGWSDDFRRIRQLTNEMDLDQTQAQVLQEDLRKRASRLVEKFWAVIEELAKEVLSKPCVPLLATESWGLGDQKRNLPSAEIIEIFKRHGTTAHVIADCVKKVDSTQHPPHYDPLA